VCAGRSPVTVGAEIEEGKGIFSRAIWYRYPGDVQTPLQSLIWPGTSVIEQERRFRDTQSGATAVIHYCFDRGRVVINLESPLPESQSEEERLSFFIRYARNLEETRGRKALVTIEDVHAAIAQRPGAGLTWVATELGIPRRTLQYLLNSKGLTFKKAKEIALSKRRKK
jgi:hypothetical protein